MREIEPLDPDKPEVIWQIGAFDGYDNVGKMVNNYPNWSFHLFEPMPDAFGVLQRNHKNRHNVHLYNVAVTDTYDTEVDFYIPAILNDPDKTWAPQVCGLTPDIVAQCSKETALGSIIPQRRGFEQLGEFFERCVLEHEA
jgi:hypothetical protein